LNGGNWRIIAEFTEIESGKRSDRPALEKALAAARVHQVPLVVGEDGGDGDDVSGNDCVQARARHYICARAADLLLCRLLKIDVGRVVCDEAACLGKSLTGHKHEECSHANAHEARQRR
jgi:hypothetical protein